MKLSLNDGWALRRPVGPFDSLSELQLTPVRLPHDALRDSERSASAPGRGSGAYYPNGAFTYMKSFFVPAEWEGQIVRLEIEGAFRKAQIFVNEEFAGNRADGYARFFVDLTPFLRFGEENSFRIEVRSGGDSRWYSGAGLHRPVSLHVDEPIHIEPDGVRVTTVRVQDGCAVVECASTLRNAGLVSRTVTLSTVISGPDGRSIDMDAVPVTLAPGDRTVVRQRFYIDDPELWGPERPALHQAEVTLDGADERRINFGIRSVTVDPRRGLRINGEEVLLRGACIHHDNGPLGAAAIGRAEERRVELLKEAGFNALRSSHNPMSSAMLDACDRLGMLVMDEAWDMWVRFKTLGDYSSDFPQWWKPDIAAMVAKDQNHPSVIMYSIGNEIAEVGSPHGSRLAREIAEHVRSLDPTRLVTNGVNVLLAMKNEDPGVFDFQDGLNEEMAFDGRDRRGSDEAATRRIEESSASLDVLGLNYAETRYITDRERYPRRVLVGSETFPSQIGRLWPMVKSSPNVIGDFTWTGWDYLGEVGIGATAYAEEPDAVPGLEREYPFLTAWCGDIDITGHRRPLSFYREIVFGLRDAPYIAVHRPEHRDHTITMQSPWAWSDSISSWTWPGHEDGSMVVEVYADADEVSLLLNGMEICRTAVGVEMPKLARCEVRYSPGELTAVAFRDGVEAGRFSIHTAEEVAGLSVVVDRERIADSDDDLAFVEIEVHDSRGRLVTGDDRRITLEVSGDAVLAGMCSANPRTEERFDSPTWSTFDGRALAVVRPSGKGTATVTVRAAGLKEVTRVITIGM
ncbi:glycoside hydrolase family 2 TIM barrel-domain containing protein [Paenarthrobacter nicotinovorans]|uniref:glycoside hydrolase family 2 TIM barrel-domain containing protein n=1 Tax=Paenarthrobacter nicotinovorans TaxID=29320 RepID=UPI003749AF0C